MHLEAAGIPTVLVSTTAFSPLAREVAETLGMPDVRIVEVGHPLGGTAEATVLDWADAAVESTLRLLTEAP